MDIITDLPPAFQNWQPAAAPADSGEGLSFGLEGAPTELAAAWQIDLPGEGQDAAARLEQVGAQIRASQQALEEATTRLDDFIQNYQAGEMTRIDFAAGAAGSLPAPESELLDWLEIAQPAGLEFGAGPEAQSRLELERLGSQVQAALEKLLQQVLHYAWVETRIEGRLLARSIVSWGGDADTVWGEWQLPGEATYHQHNLELATVSRATLLRLVIVVTSGALKISLLLTTPGGVVLALPAIWKFVRRILSEIESYQSQTQSVKESQAWPTN